MEKKEEKIIFLESNTKRSTIKSFLGSDYTIFATGGHLLSLEKTGDYNLGVDLSNFCPRYEIIKGKGNLINFWRSYIQEKTNFKIFIATDPDREGEGIAREVIQILDLKEENYERLFFHEITYWAVKESIEKPLKINNNLASAQMSREVLDRIIGFCLSTLLQKKMNAWSAGRVQSVVLKLIVDKEKEIVEYNKNKQFIIIASFKINRKVYKLVEMKGLERSLKLYEKINHAEKVIEELDCSFKIFKKEESLKYIFPKHPLTTSLLLYESRTLLGFSIQKTTSIVQQLYEGVFVKSKKKRVSLITYPRTDSSRINNLFVSQISKFIKSEFGEESFRFPFKKDFDEKKKNVQNAHEAIRPTYLSYSPDSLKDEGLEKDVLKIYDLIYNHTVISFMQPIKYSSNSYFYSNSDRFFLINEKIIVEKGFLVFNQKIASRYELLNSSLFEKYSSIEVEKKDIKVEENFEGVPRRYTEGSLIKKLEVLGIGRPSTYNSFSKIILKRKYSALEKNSFVPTDLGFKVNDWLQRRFSFLINENYTALLEEELDKISNGEQTYNVFINTFWKSFFEVYRLAESE